MASQFLRSTLQPAALLAVALAIPRLASAVTLTVTDLGDSHSTGQLRALINAAAPGDTIVIPAGTITLTGPAGEDANAGGDLDISKNLTIQGAGAGVTIIDGGGIDRVFDIPPLASATISSLTIQNGSPSNFASGGGVRNAGNLTLTDVVVNGNVAAAAGGVENDGSLSLTNVTISSNTTNGFGGGILNAGTATLTNVTVISNSASRGGGISNTEPGALMTLTSSTLSGNMAAEGGGLDNRGTLNVTNSAFSANRASQGGGGILNRGTLTVSNSTLGGNTVSVTSGGGILNHGSLTLTNSTLSGNTASTSGGGGVDNNCDGIAMLTNVTLSNNAARVGGGISIGCNSTAMLTNVTITGNSASPGGGISNGFASLQLKNSIVANNAGSNCSGPITSSGHNLSSDNSCGLAGPGDLSNINPLLGPLQNNGGPTRTHALLLRSQAIDAGSSDCPPPATDQRGIARPQGSACDIGAYEFDPAAVAAFVTRLYEGVLGRDPESGAVDNWIHQIQEDGSVVPTVLAFFHSQEFLDRHTTNEQFLTILYHTFLDREPDPAGFNAFLTALQAGQLTRYNLLDIFIDSAEFKTQASFLPPLPPLEVFVTTLYVRILGRGPDPAGLQGFVAQLQQNFTVLPTVQFFLASPEFLARNTSNVEFVTLLYRVFLNRIPDAAGLASFVALLNQGTSRDQLLAQFAASPEFRAIERTLFPLPNLAGTWNVTGSISLTSCQAPANNGTGAILGSIQVTQSDAAFQTTFSIFLGGGVVAQTTLTGTVTPNGQFSGALAGSTNAGQQFSGSFSGSIGGNAFSLQFSGQVTAGERCSLSGSMSGTRQ